MFYTDIHTHILPGIDDGAKDIEQSRAIIQAQAEEGVTQIVCTPHLYLHKQKYESFIQHRTAAYEAMQPVCAEFPQIQIRLGAEVHYSPQIAEQDLNNLCIEGTHYLLLELSSSRKPLFFEENLFQIQSQGVIPILAHIERYPYLMEDPRILAEWLDAGVLTQVNATSMLEKGEYHKAVRKFLQWDMVHLMASDTHSVDLRPPNLMEGLAELDEELQMEFASRAADVFAGKEFAIPEFRMPKKKLFGGWA